MSRRRASSTATGQRLPSFFVKEVNKPLTIQKTMGSGMLPPADHNVKGTHHLVSVNWEKASFDMLWAEARRSCCGVQRKREEGFLDHGERGG